MMEPPNGSSNRRITLCGMLSSCTRLRMPWLLLYSVVGNSFTLAIVIFTVLIRLVTIPHRVGAEESTTHDRDAAADERDTREIQRSAGETASRNGAARLWESTTMLGGCSPMLLQFPIMIGLYQSITHVAAASPS